MQTCILIELVKIKQNFAIVIALKKIILVLIFSFYSISIGQIKEKIIESWEIGDLDLLKVEKEGFPIFASTPIDYFYSDLIGFYQSKISSKSIERCPFYISCSNYTKEAIQKYGSFTGILYFIDRNLFRENIAMRTHYPIIKKGNKFKLDDSFYLFFLSKNNEN